MKHQPQCKKAAKVKQAVKNSKEDLVEKAMLEDKLEDKFGIFDFDAYEEELDEESYLQWLRDNEHQAASGNPKSASVTLADFKIQASSQASSGTDQVFSSKKRKHEESMPNLDLAPTRFHKKYQTLLLQEVKSKAEATEEYAKLVKDQREVAILQKKAFGKMAEFYQINVNSGKVFENHLKSLIFTIFVNCKA